MTNRTCPRCGEAKAADEWATGQSRCRGCNRLYMAEYREKNRESRRASSAAWRLSHPEYRRAAWHKWYAENADKAARTRAESHAANPEPSRARSRLYSRLHPEKVRAYGKQRRDILAAAQTVRFTQAEMEARFAFFGNRCWMCRGPFEHMDHVKPLSRGGPHMLANLRPACAGCNIGKSNRWYGVSGLYRFIKS